MEQRHMRRLRRDPDEKAFHRGQRRPCPGGPDGGNKAVCNNTVVTKYVVCHALSPDVSRRVWGKREGRWRAGKGEKRSKGGCPGGCAFLADQVRPHISLAALLPAGRLYFFPRAILSLFCTCLFISNCWTSFLHS